MCLQEAFLCFSHKGLDHLGQAAAESERITVICWFLFTENGTTTVLAALLVYLLGSTLLADASDLLPQVLQEKNLAHPTLTVSPVMQ